MRVQIIVHGEDLGDVEVDRSDRRLVRHLGEDSRDVMSEVLDKAVAQVRDAYRIAKADPNELPGLARAMRSSD